MGCAVEEVVRAALGLDAGDRAAVAGAIVVSLAEEGAARARAELAEPSCCPRCGAGAPARRGRDARGRQRWLCRGCGRSFTKESFGLLSRSHLPASTWAEYARAFAEGATLRDCAERCGVCLKTSFFMRHRMCEMLGIETVTLRPSGAPVEADEAYLPASFSGNHSRDPSFSPGRPSRRRGGTGGGRRRQERLITLADGRGGSEVGVAWGSPLGSAVAMMRSSLGASCVVRTERGGQMGHAARLAGLAQERAEGRVNAVNAVHSRIKRFMRRFDGVSSRRMQSYMWWFSWADTATGGVAGRLRELIALIPVGRYRTTWRAMVEAPYPPPPVPICASKNV
ncbi:hypothetical protein [Collinsella sp. An2]|uniref:IS1/IS1595 family N-terminal zinc-binding domain-containing protein n=1 Tax=Collinsella sp. An2 TaxID=1965585 RepID=UPI000B368641|nr:hypothetical protein [Collinsella sp. An2]OUP08399.1 hypothetical protein B5F33_06760 [Collinsella sp. An2]